MLQIEFTIKITMLGTVSTIILKYVDRGYNMSELSNFISSVGFPIVVSIAMFYQNNILSSNYQKLTEQLQEKIESNTETLTRLIEKLDQDNLLKEKSEK